jgi:hypothetical protein
MIRMGGDVANETPGGNHFTESRKVQKANERARKKSRVR